MESKERKREGERKRFGRGEGERLKEKPAHPN